MAFRKFPVAAALAVVAFGLQGCISTAVGVTAGATAAVVKTTAKVGGAAVGAVIPDGDKDDKKRRR
ncbi:MAG: NF038104 family lipoprotein [Pseudomonadota bacterium]